MVAVIVKGNAGRAVLVAPNEGALTRALDDLHLAAHHAEVDGLLGTAGVKIVDVSAGFDREQLVNQLCLKPAPASQLAAQVRREILS